MRVTLRNTLAAIARRLPRIRGKARIGARLARLLTNFDSAEESLVTCTMRDRGVMRLDLRSRTEEWSFWTGEYESHAIKLLGGLLRPGDVVLDVGANIGFFSVPLGRILRASGGSLHAFEPVESNFKRLSDVIALNDLE